MSVFASFVNGRFVSTSGPSLAVIEPATGREYARVADASTADVDSAVAAAKAAFPEWAARSAGDRGSVLIALADAIDANLERLASAESRDTGKPIAIARSVDIPRSSANLRYFAHAVQHVSSESLEFDGSAGIGAQSAGSGRALNYVLRQPRGVAGLISPWNLPLYLLTWKIGPALATGNTAVCKPSEVTPATATMLAELAQSAGVPAGVLNIVHGRGASAGAALVQHPDVPTISFTGSTSVGKWIAQEAGQRLKRVSLELGGKNPFIIFEDADIDEAIALATRAAFTNQGQVCLCGSRLLVQRGVYDRIASGVVAKAAALRVGDPMESQTEFGSLTSAEHLAKVEMYVELARSLGGRVLSGGSRVPTVSLPERVRGGYFFQPTVIDGLDPMCRVEQEEIFGPVVTLQPFDTEEEAIALANGTAYGLAATLLTRDVSRAHRVSAKLQAGIVWVNCWMVRDLRTPFGGMKASGVGREGGSEAMKFFTEAKTVCVGIRDS